MVIDLTTLNVGDGACTVLERSSASAEESMITVVDCGVYRAPLEPAVDHLAAHLGRRLAELDAMVVTHFDADHWRGLAVLADRFRSAGGSPRHRLRIAYPRIPLELRPAVHLYFALVATAHGWPGTRAGELLTAWEPVADVEPVALTCGDRIDLAGQRWEVLWPPRRAGAEALRRTARLLQAIEQLAEDLDAAGHPELRRNLDAVYPMVGEPRVPADPRRVDEGEEPEPVVDLEVARDPELPLEGAERAERTAHELPAPPMPEPLTKRFAALAKELGPINNALSLVMHTVGQHRPSLLFTGDIEGASLTALLRSDKLRDGYDVMLAPHHGTGAVRSGFPDAPVCIAQTGPHHDANWTHDRHLGSACISTFRSGDVSLRVPGRC